MESKRNIEENENSKKLQIVTHHKYFTAAFIKILDILLDKSNTINLNELNHENKTELKLFKNHTKLRSVCNELKYGFSSESEYDQGRIIKKIYKVITSHIDKFYPNPQRELFTLKNEEGAIITIIPGLDINLVTSMMTDDEIKNLWDYMTVMYISSVSIISLVNEHKKGKITELLPMMRKKVAESGVLSRGLGLSNPFMGLSSDVISSEKYDIDTLFQNIESIEAPTGDIIENLFEMSGIEKLVDLKQLNEQLKNVKQEDIEEATRSITKMLGAEEDSDVAEVCESLVEGIVGDMKLNSDKGIHGMFDTAKKVSKTIGQKIDKNKMGKTVDKLASFVKNSESNLKDMKDDKGNPIGKEIMEKLKGPLEMAQKMGKNQSGMGDFTNLASLMSQVGDIAKSMQK